MNRTTRTSRLIRAATLALATLTAAALTGCGALGKHGQFTQEHLNQAQEKMTMLKSGTEWQMAHQQFLAGDLDKALKTVDRSIAMNGTVPKSHLLRGRIMLEKSRLEEARQEFLTAQLWSIIGQTKPFRRYGCRTGSFPGRVRTRATDKCVLGDCWR